MLRRTLLILSAFGLAVPAPAIAESLDGGSQQESKLDTATPTASATGGQSYGDRNRGGPYGFYSYPRHRHVDGGSLGALDRAFSPTSVGTSPYHDGYHGSAYYGRNYGAPYYGGGYYDRGVYYRERRD